MDNQQALAIKEIPGFSNYGVTPDGQVYNLTTGLLLKQALNEKGYACVSIRMANRRFKRIKVHRLVAYTYIGPPSTLRPFVNHKNSIRSDNRVENLEWVSHRENMPQGNIAQKDRENIVKLYQSGVKQPAIAKRYSVSSSKISEVLLQEGARKKRLNSKDRAEIYQLMEMGLTYKQIAKRIGVSHSAVKGVGRKAPTTKCRTQESSKPQTAKAEDIV